MASLSERDGNYHYKSSFYDETGAEYKVSHKYSITGNKKSTKIKKDGKTIWSGSALNSSQAMQKISSGSPMQFFATAGDYETYKTSETKSEDFKEELGAQIDSAKEEMKALGESKDVEMRRIASRTGAGQQKNLLDTLLATGTDPAEAQAIAQYGADAQARTLTDVLNQTGLATKEAVASFNNQEIQGVVNAEQFQTQYAQLANQLSVQRESLANQLNIAEMQMESAEPTLMENISGGAAAFGQGAQGAVYLRALGIV